MSTDCIGLYDFTIVVLRPKSHHTPHAKNRHAYRSMDNLVVLWYYKLKVKLNIKLKSLYKGQVNNELRPTFLE